MTTAPHEIGNRRIIVVDDNTSVHDAFQSIFRFLAPPPSKLDVIECALFDVTPEQTQNLVFEVDSAYDGQEALGMVRQALQERKPYSMAFMDVRMPGWDGVETTARIWQEYPDLQVVLCTAHMDYSWAELVQKLGYSDRLLILKKPFENIEVVQLAYALTMKWRLLQLSRTKWKELEVRIDQSTQELELAFLKAGGKPNDVAESTGARF